MAGLRALHIVLLRGLQPAAVTKNTQEDSGKECGQISCCEQQPPQSNNNQQMIKSEQQQQQQHAAAVAAGLHALEQKLQALVGPVCLLLKSPTLAVRLEVSSSSCPKPWLTAASADTCINSTSELTECGAKMKARMCSCPCERLCGVYICAAILECYSVLVDNCCCCFCACRPAMCWEPSWMQLLHNTHNASATTAMWQQQQSLRQALQLQRSPQLREWQQQRL
jgi:hypothetical protein